MQNLRYVGKNLFIEKLSINNILKRNKTPFYLYSENQIINNFLKFKEVFKKTNPLICFAAKSNSNVSILKTLGKLGAGTDVVSGGELLKALKAGIKPNKIVFSGVGKSEDELRIAINKKILLINCESESEAKLIDKIARKLRKKVSIGFRLNPNIDAKTHQKISTGKAENKFGLSIKNFKSFYKSIKKYKNIRTDFECKACGKSFEKQKGLSLHKTRYCKFSRKGVPSGAPVTSTVNPNSDNSFRCANCNSTYKTLGGLRIHQSSKLGKAKCQRLKAARIANAEVVQDPPINLAQNHEIFDWKNAILPNKVDTPDIVKIMVRKPKLKLPHLNCQQEWTNLEEKILKGLN